MKTRVPTRFEEVLTGVLIGLMATPPPLLARPATAGPPVPAPLTAQAPSPDTSPPAPAPDAAEAPAAPPAAAPVPMVDSNGQPLLAQAGPALAIRRATTVAGQPAVIISYPTDSSHNYVVEYLDPPGFDRGPYGWRPLPGAPHNEGSVTDLESSAQRFYRVRVLDLPQKGIIALLANDTGLSPSDGITADPTVVGRVLETGTPTDLRARLDANALLTVISNIPSRTPFTLAAEVLARLGGGPVADGPHSLYLEKYDEVRNILWHTNVAFVLDTGPPDTFITSHPLHPTNETVARFTFVGTDNLTPPDQLRFEFRHAYTNQQSGVSNQPSFVTAWAPCQSPHTLSNLAEGWHTFEVRAIDLAGNVDPTPAAYTWFVDLTPPETYLVVRPPRITNGNTVVIEATNSEPSTVQCRLDGGAWLDCSTVSILSGLPEGIHTYEIQATDYAGNVGPIVSCTWTNDYTPPPQFINVCPPSPSFSRTEIFDFYGTDNFTPPDRLIFECRHYLLPVLDPATTNWGRCTSPAVLNHLPDGTNVFEVRAIDEAGNVDPTPARCEWVVIGPAPTISLALHPDYDSPPTNDLTTTFTNVLLIGWTQPLLPVALASHTNYPCAPADATFLAATVADAAGFFAFPNVALVPGPNYFSATATDLFGNTASVCLPVTNVVECRFPDLAGWLVSISPPSSLAPNPVPGRAVATNCDILLTEGDSFQVAIETLLTIPAGPGQSPSGILAITYETPSFDGTATNLMRDAFEVALVDTTGRPLTFTIQSRAGVPPASSTPPVLPPSPDALFNHSDGYTPFLAPGAALSALAIGRQQLAIDVSHLPPDSTARLILRLVNNDLDRLTSVRLTDLRFLPADPGLDFTGSPGTALSLLAKVGTAVPSGPGASRCPSGNSTYGTPITSAAVIPTNYFATGLPGPETPDGDSVLPPDGRLIFTTTAEFLRGTLFNLTAEDPPNELRLVGHPTTYPLFWVANAGEDTVSKIDIRTGRELARYRTWFGPAGQPGYFNHLNNSGAGAAPSRTVVDQDGNVFVANRHFDNRPADVIKILALGGIDRNTNGIIDTSTDLNTNGVIEANEMLPMGDYNGNGRIDPQEVQDERIAWVATVGPAGGLGRALAIDRDGNIWLGLYNARTFYKLSPDDGRVLLGPVNVSPHQPYGAVIDGSGMLWSVSYGTSLLKLDTVRLTNRIYSLGSYLTTAYGITVGNNRIYISAYQGGCTFLEFDPVPETFRAPARSCFSSLHLAVDTNGDLFAGPYTAGGLTKFRPDGTVIWSRPKQPGTGEVRGTVVDSENNVWQIHRNTSNISKFRGSDGEPLGVFPVGNYPYTYTDATGLARIMAMPSGTWTEIVDSGRRNTIWGAVALSSTTPLDSSVRLRVRASDSRSALTNVPYAEATPGQTLPQVIGQYIQVEVALRAGATNVSPAVHDITVLAVPPPTLFSEAPGEVFAPGATILLSGRAIAARPGLPGGGVVPNAVTYVLLNGSPLASLDAAGNFYAPVTIQPGRNEFQFTATDLFGLSSTNTLVLWGACPETAAQLRVVSASIQPEYGRTSFNEWPKTLYADLAIRNIGTYPIRAPFYVGITRLSDPTVRLLAPDGVTADGIPYYDFSAALTNAAGCGSPSPGGEGRGEGDRLLRPGQASLARTLAFHNPNRVQFTYDLVVLGQLNHPPYFTTAPPLEAIVDRPYTYHAAAVDPDADPVTLSLLSAPAGLMLTPVSPSPGAEGRGEGVLSWTPTTNDLGTHTITLQASDGRGGTAEQHYLLNVIAPPPNRPPYFISQPVILAWVGSNYVYDADAIDLDGDPILYAIAQGPHGMQIEPYSGVVSWAPSAEQIGQHAVTLEASDGRGGIATQSYIVTVLPDPANHPPVIVSQPVTATTVGTPYSYCVEAVDADNDTLAYSLAVAPTGVVIDPTNGVIRWNPGSNDLGSHLVRLRVSDGRGGSDEQSFSLAVLPAPDLIISGMSRQGLYFDGQNLTVGGQITANVTNRGPGPVLNPFDVLFFEDRNLNGGYDASEDNLLGSTTMAPPIAAGEGRLIVAELAGNVLFPENVIWGFVDARQEIAEMNETNNLSNTGVECVAGPLAVPDLVAAYMRLVQGDGVANVTVRIGNGGGLVTPGNVQVAFYAGEPGLPQELLGVVSTVAAIAPGAFEDVTLTFTNVSCSNIWVAADDDGTRHGAVLECDELNNVFGPGAVGAGEIRGNVFNDVNGNGLRDSSEPQLAGWTVFIDQNANNQRDQDERFAVSDNEGAYALRGLRPGTYHVCEVVLPGWLASTPACACHEVRIADGDSRTGVDFANRPFAAVTNWPPRFTSVPPTNATVGQLFRYAVSVFDADGDSVSFDLQVAPEGMVVQPVSGVLAWIPRSEQVGIHHVLLRAQDGRGGVALQPFQVTVRPANTGPVITSQPTGPASVGVEWRYQVRAQDADGDPISFRLDAGPTNMVLIPVTPAEAGVASCLLQWTPLPSQPGTNRIAITASDDHGAATTQLFDLPVVLPTTNRPPNITSTPRTSIGLGATYYYLVEAFDPDGDPLTFSLLAGPVGMVLTNAALLVWTPAPAQFGSNFVAVRVEDGRGGQAEQSFWLLVATHTSNQPPTIISTPRLAAVVGQAYAYDARALDPEGDPLAWGLDISPTGMSVDPSLGTVRWTPTLAQLGTNAVRVRVVDSQGAWAVQSYNIVVRTVNLPPQIVSQPPTRAATNQLYTYTLCADDPEGDALTFSVVRGPTNLTFDPLLTTPNSATVRWIPTPSQLGTNTIELRVVDSAGGAAEQAFQVVVSDSAENRFPAITSTPGQVAEVNSLYQYQVTAADPDGDPLEFVLLAGPVGMALDARTGLVQWTPTTGQLGTHTVSVGAVDPEGAGASQTFTLTVIQANSPPRITSVPIRSVMAGALYSYDVAATDAEGGRLTYTLTGPAGMTIDQMGRILWQTTLANVGTHPVAVTVTDPVGAYARQEYDLAVIADTSPPAVQLNCPGQPIPLGTTLDIIVLPTDNSGHVTAELTINGLPIALNANNQARYRPNATGPHEVVARATDPAGNCATNRCVFLVYEFVNDGTYPEVSIIAPTDDAVVTGRTNVIGTAADTNLLYYTLAVKPLEGNTFTEVFRGTNSVVNGVLGRFDSSTLANDTYVLRLTAVDAGGLTASAEITVHVSGELKVGNFRLSFTDLSIPVNGVPIIVARTYDSLEANRQGDFGYGWRLEFRDANLRTSVPRTGAEAEGIFNPFREGSRVYVTVPGGRREGFTFRPRVERTWFVVKYYPQFVPEPGVTSRLAPANPRYEIYPADGEYYDAVAGLPYNPADPVFGGDYILTTKDGTRYQINGLSGRLSTISDPNGNTLTFTPTAIISSAGPRVTISRDPQGRITAVTDPAGRQIRYEYDARGDLVAVTDRESNVTRLVYHPALPHYLQEVLDPLGRTGVRTEYDAQGRLVQLTDAAGNPVHLIHRTDEAMEQVVDALGHTNTFVYDERGNVVVEINALGCVTRRAYDANNFMTTEVDALGNTNRFEYDSNGNLTRRIDPLGNVTLLTYGINNQVLTTTDPLGSTTRNEYDAKGNLTATIDPAGNVTRYTYDSAGNQTSITDPLGHVTRFEYDGTGRLLRQTDALGNVTAFTYDANGNQLSQTIVVTVRPGVLRTNTTFTAYDANGRPISVTDPAGNITRTEYDALGNVKAMIDALGHRTEFFYDERGRLTNTVFPDGTCSRMTYDAAGRRTSSTDRAGRTTYYEYDALGHLTATIYPDETPGDLSDNPRTRITYDLAGRMIAQTDERGNTTWFGYDAAGRQVAVTNALGYVIRSAYDAAGRKIAETDPLDRTTQFVYDALGRRVQTIFPDGTVKRTLYDPLGRVVAEVDQAGVTNAFGYDALGRLTSVTNALGTADQTVTHYEYNEAGKLVLQRDANGHVTRYEYEPCCQRTATILPLGQRSTTLYNAVNDVVAVTNFNGQVIRYEYDVNNRLAVKTLPDGSTVRYSYTPTGRRAAITNSMGVTRWTYDARDRLLSRTDPDGRGIEYAYDAAGNRTRITTFKDHGTRLTNHVWTFTFDPLNRLETVTDPQGGITRYTYDAANNIRVVALPNGTFRTNLYDALNRVTNIIHAGPTGVFASFRYTVAPTGNRLSVQELTGRTVRWTYDGLNRLIGETVTGDPNGQNYSATYVYDAVGNRLSLSNSLEGVTAYQYDDNDQLLSEFSSGIRYPASGIRTEYTYDANGNTLSRSNANECALYVWSAENRLIAATITTNGITRQLAYAYDDDGIRMVASVTEAGNTTATTYLVDANRPYAQVVEELIMDLVAGTTNLVLYTYGHHHPISQNRNGELSFYHADHLGSTRVLTSPTGTATDRYTFDAYGRTLRQTGLTGNSYLFAGEWREWQLNLDYLRARYLSFAAGRFVSRDAHPGRAEHPQGLHPFAYAENNPVNCTDPSGLVNMSELMAVLMARVALAPMVYREAAFGAARVGVAYVIAKAVLEPAADLQEKALQALVRGACHPDVFDAYLVGREATALGFQLLEVSLIGVELAEASVAVALGIRQTQKGLNAILRHGSNPEAVADVIQGLNSVRCGLFAVAKHFPGLEGRLHAIISGLGTCP